MNDTSRITTNHNMTDPTPTPYPLQYAVEGTRLRVIYAPTAIVAGLASLLADFILCSGQIAGHGTFLPCLLALLALLLPFHGLLFAALSRRLNKQWSWLAIVGILISGLALLVFVILAIRFLQNFTVG